MTTENHNNRNEISATNAARPLLTLSLKPQELDRHRAEIGVEVEASLNNGGYWSEPSSQLVKMKMLMKWMDALQNYSIDEIEAAFSQHVMKDPKRKPNEGIIYNIIIANRQRVVASQPTTPEPEPERIQATMEQRQAIMDEVNFSGDVKVRKFTEKPEERE